jgi:hypothetical protein
MDLLCARREELAMHLGSRESMAGVVRDVEFVNETGRDKFEVTWFPVEPSQSAPRNSEAPITIIYLHM